MAQLERTMYPCKYYIFDCIIVVAFAPVGLVFVVVVAMALTA